MKITKHAKKVYKGFGLKNMGEYHDFYLPSDVLLLADVVKNFRKTCLQYYKLDPAHYFTSLCLSSDDRYPTGTNSRCWYVPVCWGGGISGGISYIANRHGQANNKYMENYDKSNRSKYITYLDANNLYGWAMSQYLPTGNLKWLTDKQIKQLDINDFKHDINNGMILEVHLQYPEELHDLHNDYPLASEKIKVTENM